jgi:hypothetical protein
MMQFARVNRLNLDELWSFAGKRQHPVTRIDLADF